MTNGSLTQTMTAVTAFLFFAGGSDNRKGLLDESLRGYMNTSKTAMEPGQLRRLTGEILPEIVDFRHELHMYPEPGLEEFETAGRIRERIRRYPVDIQEPLVQTDTVALMHGLRPGRNVTLRADIDALRLEEKSTVSWQSRNKACAHSCGHDGHAAMLLGALTVLAGLRDRFCGSVRFVFQPAEEKFGGGRQMVEKGLLDAEPLPSAVFALHGWPELPVGTIAARSGVYMAAADRFSIRIEGRGGHGAKPHLAVDPIVTGTRVVQALQTIISRSVDPAEPAVVSVCTFHGGAADNVIPDEVAMTGTVRYFNGKLKSIIRTRMEDLVKGICESSGARYKFDYEEGYIPLENDPEKVAFARRVVRSYLGTNSWSDELPLTTSSEDFSFYLRKVPGVFLRLGLGTQGYNLHNPHFDFNDQAIESGIMTLVALVLESLDPVDPH